MGARTLRLADGPDEVHKILIAKNVLGRYDPGESWDFGNETTPVSARCAPPSGGRGAERGSEALR